MIECDPTVRALVVKVALSLLPIAPEPSVVDPSLKVTVPVGVAVKTLGVNVAVKVMLCPKFEGFAELEREDFVPPVFSRMVTFWSFVLATARSGAPSPLKSPTAIACEPLPEL